MLQTLSSAIFLWLTKVWPSDGCTELSGIGDGIDDLYTVNELLFAGYPIYPNGVLFEVLFDSFTQFGDVETAINVYYAGEYAVVNYNVLAAFEPDIPDFWGRENVTLERRRCGADNSTIYSSVLYTLHYKLVSAFSWYYQYKFTVFFTDALAKLGDKLLSYGIDPYICDDPTVFDCDGDIGTPWGLAYTIAKETNEFWLKIGWNADGSYNREYNRVRFEDWRDDDTKYVPVNTLYKLDDNNRWQPIDEDDGRGFLFGQKHILPHIGYTGKSIFFTDDQLCDRELYYPFYNYTYEINLLIDRLKDTMLTDEIKMETEFFDNKVASLTQFSTFYTILQGNDFDKFEGAFALQLESIINYEVTLAVWKAKVDYDLIRPLNLIRHLFKDEMITTYAGVDFSGAGQGTQTYLGKNFEAYLRTMPHAEYPSGSSCICSAYAEGQKLLYNDIDILIPPLTYQVSPFSSEIEPLTTPKKNITFTYFGWGDISKRCGETRYEGGMHFTESVPAGVQLCADIGRQVAQKVIGIKNGIRPDYQIDFINDRAIRERDCYPNRNKCKLPKKCQNNPCLVDELLGNCKKYENGTGCTKCNAGFYLYDADYPCIECKKSCDNCEKCTDYRGCKKCTKNGKFTLKNDNNTHLDYCQPKTK